jgi:hypothetical protein
MKHTLYEDPITRRFALIRLPPKFVEGDALEIRPTAQWFTTREAALAALRELLNEDE